MPERPSIVRWLDAVPSTQEVAHLLAESGAGHGAAVAAREQRSGRGTRGRTWFSPIGGLWMSVVCRPRSPASAECFSVRVGLAVAAAIETRLPGLPEIMLKWPNDLYLSGRKLGGILCEARWLGADLSWIVAGIGLNVRNPLPPEVAGTATSLAGHGAAVTPEDLADPIAHRVAAQAVTGGPLDGAELAEFSRRDFLRGRRIVEPVAGVALGIDRDAALLIRDASGVDRRATAGSVVLGEPAPIADR